VDNKHVDDVNNILQQYSGHTDPFEESDGEIDRFNVEIDDESQDLSAIKQSYNDNLKKLSSDTDDIEKRMSHVSSFIATLKSQINTLETLISQATMQDRAKYYGVLNNLMEINARYEDIYLRCMELRFRYRSEYNDVTNKRERLLSVDIRKLNISDNNSIDIGGLMGMMRKLDKQFNADIDTASGLQQQVEQINNDPNYKL
jgi:hypothetical protein